MPLMKTLETLGRQEDEPRNILVYTGISWPQRKFDEDTLLHLKLKTCAVHSIIFFFV